MTEACDPVVPTCGTPTVPALFLVFASMGASAATVPAVIPVIAEMHPGAIEEYLRAVPSLFYGLLVGVLLSSVSGRARSPRQITMVGSGVQAAGFAFLTLAGTPWRFSCVVLIIGVGFGLVEAGGSVLARAIAGDHTARLLAALTGTVAVVASSVPLLVALTPAGQAPQVVFLFVAAVHLSAFTLFLLTRPSDVRDQAYQDTTISSERAGPAGPQSTNLVGLLIAVGVSLALYVGVETVYAGWSSTIPLLVLNLSAQQAAIGTSIFWALLALGRYLAAFVMNRSVGTLVYLMGSTTAAALALGGTALMVSTEPVLATIFLCIAVTALGPCYSLILGSGLSRIPVTRARWATGLLVACGAGGGALIPTFVLTITDSPTSIEVFAVTGVLTVTSGVLVALKTRHSVPATASPAHT